MISPGGSRLLEAHRKMLVVGIDTAGPVVGVSLWDGARVFERTQRIRRGAEALLLPWLEELCQEAGVQPADITGVGVSAGPGAFTGLRVGMSTAAGLAFSLNVPLWSGSSLVSRGRRVFDGTPLLVLLDARKSKVYGQGFDEQMNVLGGPADVPPEEALSWMEGPFFATGEGAIVYREKVEAAGGTVLASAADPSVGALAQMAAEGIARGEGAPATQLSPVYLRPPDAKPSGKGRI